MLALAAMTVAAAAVASDDEARKADARRHFDVGLDLVHRRAFDSALAEFLRSRELFPTESALLDAAVCLRELGRADEAMDMYEELRARFAGAIPEADRKAIEANLAKLVDQTGWISVTTDLPGAAVSVDGRARGTAPLDRPLRVTVGHHVVRVVAEGRAPFDAEVDVAPRDTRTVAALLPPVARIGTLVVSEAGGRVFEVLVDGSGVGVTPWKGVIASGDHLVALRGAKDEGAPPVPVRVETGEVREVRLAAGLLDGELRVEPTPDDARVTVDGIDRGTGTWTGSVPSGDHLVEVSAPWHEPQQMHVTVSSRAPAAVRPVLERVRRLYVELFAGMSFFSNTGASMTGCDETTCIGNPGGGRIGYLLTPHLALEIAVAGFTMPHRSIHTATASFGGSPVSSPSYQEDANLGLGIYAISVARRFFDRTPLTLRWWTGVAFASASVEGQGFFDDHEYYNQSNDSTYATPLAGPEVRIGYRLGRSVAVDIGVAAFFFYVRPLQPLPDTTVVFGSSPLSPGRPSRVRSAGPSRSRAPFTWTFCEDAMMGRLAGCLILSSSLALASVAAAQPAEDPRALAERHFRIGLELVRERAWDPALAEFARSREAMPTANAIENWRCACASSAGSTRRWTNTTPSSPGSPRVCRPASGARSTTTWPACNASSGARRSPVIPPARRWSSTVAFEATTPLAAPLRVSVGRRSVRLTIAGFAPYEANLEVASGETSRVAARLAAVSKLGRVHVEEATGGGASCRSTASWSAPPRGRYPHGRRALDGRPVPGRPGTAPEEVEVAMGDTKARDPAGRTAARGAANRAVAGRRARVDRRSRGFPGSWSGMLPTGDHVVDVVADWHTSEHLPVRVTSGSAQSLRPALSEVPRMYVDLWGGPVMLFNMADRGIQSCATCEGTFVALGGGYKVTSHVGVELYVLFAFLKRGSVGTASTNVPWPPGTASTPSYSQDTQLTTSAAGGAVRYRFFDHTPLTLRLLAAVARETAVANAGGTFYATTATAVSSRSPIGRSTRTTGRPSQGRIRFGYEFRPGMTFDVGLGVLLFAAPSTRSDTNPPFHDTQATLPPGPWFAGGLGCIVPLPATCTSL